MEIIDFIYESPDLEVIEVVMEHGFATTGIKDFDDGGSFGDGF